MSLEHQKRFTHEFNSMDIKKDGKLCLEELHSGFKQLMKSDLGEGERQHRTNSLFGYTAVT